MGTSKPWTRAELDYLTKNFEYQNNAKLAANLTVISTAERTPSAIASKLHFLSLSRNTIQKKEICGLGYGKKCVCCLEHKSNCMCKFDRPHRKFKRVFRCIVHGEFVWRERGY